jgi:signal recognition particle subunit SRP54
VIFENLSEKLFSIFKKLKSKGKLSEKDVKTSLREVRIALLEADVNYKVAKEFIAIITEKAIKSDILECLTPAQMVIKIVNKELTNLLGEFQCNLKLSSTAPSIILLCGLQGSGKTTQAAKLALMLKKQNYSPLLVACDVYRPAAIEQLRILGKSINVPVFEIPDENPVQIAQKALIYSKDYGNNVIILDTAGRLHIDEILMNELKTIKEAVNPNEILLVSDAMTGQDAVNIAQAFNSSLDITGLIFTKLDGDTRGGAVLSIKNVVGKPIKFIGVGEKIEDLDVFYPDRMASRILGMGDILGLIEETERNFSNQKADKLAQKFEKNAFDFNDLAEYLNQIKKMGPLKSILGKFPGMENKLKNVDINDKIIDRMHAMISSMTKKERKNSQIINHSRKRRISAGSGTSIEEVNKLLKQFEKMQKFFKKFSGKSGKRKFFKFAMPNAK